MECPECGADMRCTRTSRTATPRRRSRPLRNAGLEALMKAGELATTVANLVSEKKRYECPDCGTTRVKTEWKS